MLNSRLISAIDKSPCSVSAIYGGKPMRTYKTSMRQFVVVSVYTCMLMAVQYKVISIQG